MASFREKDSVSDRFENVVLDIVYGAGCFSEKFCLQEMAVGG